MIAEKGDIWMVEDNERLCQNIDYLTVIKFISEFCNSGGKLIKDGILINLSNLKSQIRQLSLLMSKILPEDHESVAAAIDNLINSLNNFGAEEEKKLQTNPRKGQVS